MQTGFLKIARANGECYYFNLNQLAMIYQNPDDKTVVVTGSGFEKKFRADEAQQIIAQVENLTPQPEA
jgi:hypothetical protein